MYHHLLRVDDGPLDGGRRETSEGMDKENINEKCFMVRVRVWVRGWVGLGGVVI